MCEAVGNHMCGRLVHRDHRDPVENTEFQQWKTRFEAKGPTGRTEQKKKTPDPKGGAATREEPASGSKVATEHQELFKFLAFDHECDTTTFDVKAQMQQADLKFSKTASRSKHIKQYGEGMHHVACRLGEQQHAKNRRMCAGGCKRQPRRNWSALRQCAWARRHSGCTLAQRRRYTNCMSCPPQAHGCVQHACGAGRQAGA